MQRRGKLYVKLRVKEAKERANGIINIERNIMVRRRKMCMEIYGKCGCEEWQLANSIRDGFNRVELQLLEDFEQQSVDKVVELVEKKVRENKLQIVSIHTPIKGSVSYEIEDLIEDDKKLVMYKSFYLANEVAKLMGKRVNVVVHMRYNFTDLKSRGDIMYKIIREVDVLLGLFEHVGIVIENMCPVVLNEDEINFVNNGYMDNVRLVEALRKKLDTNRVGTVLDTTHMMAYIKLIEQIKKIEKIDVRVPRIEDFFVANDGMLEVVHLGNVNGLGLTAKTHATVFDTEKDDDVNKLKEICRCIEEYRSDVPVILELREKEYKFNSNINKLETLRALGELGVRYSLE